MHPGLLSPRLARPRLRQMFLQRVQPSAGGQFCSELSQFQVQNPSCKHTSSKYVANPLHSPSTLPLQPPPPRQVCERLRPLPALVLRHSFHRHPSNSILTLSPLSRIRIMAYSRQSPRSPPRSHMITHSLESHFFTTVLFVARSVDHSLSFRHE